MAVNGGGDGDLFLSLFLFEFYCNFFFQRERERGRQCHKKLTTRQPVMRVSVCLGSYSSDVKMYVLF